MITILASLLGFMGSTLPNLFKIFEDKSDKAQELAIMGMQIEFAKLNLATQLHEVQIGADAQEMKTLYSTYSTGIPWVDALNGCVRPVIAFAFFGLFFLVKIPVIIMALHNMNNIADFNMLWTQEDGAIFAGIISFYYGSRAMQKYK
jgi:hypothetical protein